MKIIYFRFDKEVIYFCEMLFRLTEEIEVRWKKDKHWGYEVQLHDENITIDQIITCFVDVFLHERFNPMLKKIAQEDYFYSDTEEIERICLLTNWIISEKFYQDQLFGEYQTLSTYMFHMLKSNMKHLHLIHFDSLVTFCMQPIRACIQEAVGFGIDEMKREEEYQTFVHSVRHYILNRETKTEALHIVQGKHFNFYNALGVKYSRDELRSMMQREPLYLIGLDENEVDLSPVITLLPKQIYIYGNHPSEAKTLALINLFEERVTFLPLEEFPFHLNVN